MSAENLSDENRFVWRGRGNHQRPPWATESAVKDHCTSCSKCMQVCPEGIIVRGPAGTPVIDFSKGGCTFCAKCVETCPEPVFSDMSDPPWVLQASIGDGCLLNLQISCQLCTDACDLEALKLDLSQRPTGRIQLDRDICTGCGACVSFCPQSAIEIAAMKKETVNV